MQGSLTVAGHKFVPSLPDQRSLRSYENKAEQMDSPTICHCRILTRKQQYVKHRENPHRFVGEQRDSPMICDCWYLERMRQYVENKAIP